MSDIQKVIAALSEIDAKSKEGSDGIRKLYDGMLASLEASLSTIAEEASGERVASAIDGLAKSLAALKIQAPDVKVAAPEVTVNVPQQAAPVVKVDVSPTPVNVEAVMPPIPAPVVHLMKDSGPCSFTVKITKRGYGGIEEMTITKNQLKED